jgi:NAD(P)-dependent dehydrogenase (short-subunit alcohol dehydrogenase family)
MDRLENKRIIVTGGANGLGAEYVRALHAEGAVVAIADRDVVSGATLAAEFADRCIFVELDVRDMRSIQHAFATVHEQFGGLDVLINNAGIYPHKAFDDIQMEDWHEVMKTNLDSVFLCTKEAVKYLKLAGGGKIVNIATNLVFVMAPDMAHYIASKAGVVGFTRGAARELGASGITINTLAPGANMPEGELGPRGIERMRQVISYQVIKRPQMACDLTGPIVFLCSSDSDFMSGQVMCVDGGIAAY